MKDSALTPFILFIQRVVFFAGISIFIGVVTWYWIVTTQNIVPVGGPIKSVLILLDSRAGSELNVLAHGALLIGVFIASVIFWLFSLFGNKSPRDHHRRGGGFEDGDK